MAPRVVRPLVPETEREWRLYRVGFHEGVATAQREAQLAAENFRLRSLTSGVQLTFPCWPPVQTSAPKRRRAS